MLGEFVEPPMAILTSLDLYRDGKIQREKIRQHSVVIANAHKFGANSGVNFEDIPTDLFDLLIVDEAHHYPAETWKRVVNHFPFPCKKLFLTATPKNKGKDFKFMCLIFFKGEDILPSSCLAYELLHVDAVKRGIIRDTNFTEVGHELDNEIERAEVKVFIAQMN